jgi:arylsulfatase A-like enzyme
MLKGPAHYQGVIHVPFIWSDPEQKGGAVSEAVSGTIDIAQTVLDRARIAPYHGIQGQSLVPATRGEPMPNRPGVLVEQETTMFAFGRPKPFRVRTLVTPQWRMTFSDDPEVCELYDLLEDPAEMHDLWRDPSREGVRQELLQMLAAQLILHQDDTPLPTAQA